MFFKNHFDSERIYSIRPNHLSADFIHLLNLLTDEDILLTFNEREELYKSINKIIKFLEKKKELNYNEENNSGC